MNNKIKYIEELIRQEVQAIKNIPITDQIEHAVSKIHHQVHELQGKVVISGMGKAGQIGQIIATTFSSTGTPAVFLHPGEAQHGDIGILQQNDILLLISNSGKTREVIELVGLVKKLYAHIPVIAITGNTKNTLATMADIVLWTGNPQEIDTLGLTPTTSTTVMTIMGDILVVLMMQKIHFTVEDYALRHHGGYIGDTANKKLNNL